MTFEDVSKFEPNTSTLDHLAIRAGDPLDEKAVREFMEANGVEIIDVGNRYGSEGVGLSIYLKDPEGNVVELKGPPMA